LITGDGPVAQPRRVLPSTGAILLSIEHREAHSAKPSSQASRASTHPAKSGNWKLSPAEQE
jgi:hypothetical protein